jgi:manganese/zinc/iron transport system ATP- binding protein
MRLVAAGSMQSTFTDANLQRTYGGRLTVLSQAAESLARDTRGRSHP